VKELHAETPPYADRAAAAAKLQWASARAEPCQSGSDPQALKEIVQTGRTAADELIDRWEGAWGGDLGRLFAELSY